MLLTAARFSCETANCPERAWRPNTMAAKKAKKTGAKRKPNAAFMKPMTPSDTLAEIVGAKPLPRTEVTSKVWAYIKKHGLQDSKDRKQRQLDRVRIQQVRIEHAVCVQHTAPREFGPGALKT